jgi:hypothetical protein
MQPEVQDGRPHEVLVQVPTLWQLSSWASGHVHDSGSHRSNMILIDAQLLSNTSGKVTPIESFQGRHGTFLGARSCPKLSMWLVTGMETTPAALVPS